VSKDIRRRTLLTAGMAAGAVSLTTATLTPSAYAAGGPLIGRATRGEVHVMSFNIRLPVDEPPRSWMERRRLVRDLLRGERPTLLGTQEGTFAQLQDVAEDLGEHYDWIHLFRRGGSEGEATAIFYDRTRLKALAYDHLWLSATPRLAGSRMWDSSSPRMLTWVRFVDRHTGRQLVHLNTHFDHESARARRRAAAMVAGIVRSFDVPVVITGDFNSAPAGPTHRILLSEGLVDAWDAARERLTASYATYNGWDPSPVEGGRRIDWILASEDVTVVKAAVNTWTLGWVPPSDHWPVQALVRLA
jgi:endonuclease/exonuclease/phosphatase family metal-dependent hydrolase